MYNKLYLCVSSETNTPLNLDWYPANLYLLTNIPGWYFLEPHFPHVIPRIGDIYYFDTLLLVEAAKTSCYTTVQNPAVLYLLLWDERAKIGCITGKEAYMMFSSNNA